MADSNRQADALLTEHFRYTPLSLIDEIINAVNTIIYRALEAIENGLFSIPPPTLGFGDGKSQSAAVSKTLAIADADGDGNVEYPEAKDEIENGVHQLETLLEATVDKTFDKFEIYTLRNILTVPDDLTGWIRLAHYENLTLPLPPTAPTPESILHLRRKLAETKKLNRALHTTHAKNRTLLSSLSTLLSPPPTSTSNSTSNPIIPLPPHPTLTFLTTHPLSPPPLPTSSTSHTPQPPLTTHAHFTTSHLPSLHTLLSTLKPKLHTLRPENLKEVDWQSQREERRRYIEGQVRRIVMPGGGGGEEGRGERRGEEEVRGLEGVVRGLVGEGEGEVGDTVMGEGSGI